MSDDLAYLSARLAALMLVALPACATQLPPEPKAVPAVDRAAFELEAGPLLSKRCGDGSCHGRPERPLRLFAAGRYRMITSEQFSSKPLSAAEWDANYNSALGLLDQPQPRQTTLLRKALGQMAHGGQVVFEAPSDPQFRAVEAWILGNEW